MNEIKIFENPVFGKIRTAGNANNPMFCLTDICRVLGINNATDVKKRLKEDGVDSIEVIDSMGRTQRAHFINEQNLYRLIMRSDKPIAEPFQDWVCGDVLPSIRKTGSYCMPNFKNPAEAARAWADQYEKTLALEAKNKELKPKAQYFDALVERSLLTGFRDTAKELGLKQNEFIKILIDNGYVYKTPKGEIRPIAKYANDLFELKDFKSLHNEHAGVRTWITVKGKKVFQMLFGKH